MYKPGAYVSENPTHYYLPHYAYLGQESGQKTMKEWTEQKKNAVFELGTLDLTLSIHFKMFYFLIFISHNWGDNSRLVARRGW